MLDEHDSTEGDLRGDLRDFVQIVAQKEVVIGSLRDQMAEAAEQVEKSNLLRDVAIACGVVSTVGASIVALAAGVGL